MPFVRGFKKAFNSRNTKALEAVGVQMVAHAKELSLRHNDLGNRTRAIGYSIQDGKLLMGINKTMAPNAEFLDLGFVPHFVPAKYIRGWASRHGVPLNGGIFVGRSETTTLEKGPSQYLPAGKVGHPIIQPTYDHFARRRNWVGPFLRGWVRGK